jgi:hypothetical protein
MTRNKQTAKESTFDKLVRGITSSFSGAALAKLVLEVVAVVLLAVLVKAVVKK